jgi:hypothetical protein
LLDLDVKEARATEEGDRVALLRAIQERGGGEGEGDATLLAARHLRDVFLLDPAF